jgi:hypothetical protein
VRITSGNTVLGPNERRDRDLVVMDDFIFGELTPTGFPTNPRNPPNAVSPEAVGDTPIP